MRFYWVRDIIQKNSFPHILRIRKEKPSGLCHKTPPNILPYNNETNIFKKQ